MSKSPLTDAGDYLARMTSSLAGQIKAKYNLMGVKWGHAHVETSSDEAVKVIAHMLGYSSDQERAGGNAIFLCWIAVPIDDDDYCIKTDSKEQEDKVNRHKINSIEGMMAGMEFQRHLTSIDEVEEVLSRHLKCRVLPGMYAIMEGDVKYRRLSWLVATQTQASKTTARAELNAKYEPILGYFEKYPFGSEMPVLTLLSTLPPRDRCSILEVIRAKDPSNVEVYNKLSMAYLKNGQESKARELLQEGLETGALDDFTFQQLDEKISFLHANMQVSPEQEAALRAAGAAAPRPSQSYAETIGILSGRYADDASGQFREFYQLLMSLCQQHQSK